MRELAGLTLAYRAPVRDVAADGSVSRGWGPAIQILGRIMQRTTKDRTSNGRDGLPGRYLLITPDEIEGRGRIFQASVDLDRASV